MDNLTNWYSKGVFDPFADFQEYLEKKHLEKQAQEQLAIDEE
jgi:hypothetical protein